MVEPPEDERPGLPVLFFTEVPEPKAGKNRVHIDVVADETVDDEVIRLEGIGATLRNWAEEEGNVWAVMLDPEGNEFCVMPPAGWPIGQPRIAARRSARTSGESGGRADRERGERDPARDRARRSLA